MTCLIIGTCDATIAAVAQELRQENQSIEIQLKSAREFDKDRLSDVQNIYVVGDFPEIVSAYGDRVRKVVPIIAGSDVKADSVSEDNEPILKKKVNK